MSAANRNLVEVTTEQNIVEALSEHNIVEIYTTFGATGPRGLEGPIGPTGPAGTPESVSYVHNQAVSSNNWPIAHNLGWYPNITVVDSAGSIVEGHIDYDDENNITLTFSAAFSGKAYLS